MSDRLRAMSGPGHRPLGRSALIRRLAFSSVLAVVAVWAPDARASPPPVDPFDPGSRIPPVVPPDGIAPLSPEANWTPPSAAGPAAGNSQTPVAPLGEGPPPPPEPDPRELRVVRPKLVVGMLWRIERAEPLVLASVEFGRLQGLSGSFHTGVIVAPDRDFVSVIDVPIGAGFVARRPLGNRSVFGSVGLSAGMLVHRAGTNLGVVHRLDPDLQLPLELAWTPGRVGMSIVVLQGLSLRGRTYERRGAVVWERIPYRVGLAIGLHFDVGVGPPKRRGAKP